MELVPEFEARVVTGEFTRTVYDIVEEAIDVVSPAGVTRTRVKRTIKAIEQPYDKGIFVQYPRGHSIMVPYDDHEQIARLGLINTPDLVDLNAESMLDDNDNPLRASKKPVRSKSGGLDDI